MANILSDHEIDICQTDGPGSLLNGVTADRLRPLGSRPSTLFCSYAGEEHAYLLGRGSAISLEIVLKGFQGTTATATLVTILLSDHEIDICQIDNPRG